MQNVAIDSPQMRKSAEKWAKQFTKSDRVKRLLGLCFILSHYAAPVPRTFEAFHEARNKLGVRSRSTKVERVVEGLDHLLAEKVRARESRPDRLIPRTAIGQVATYTGSLYPTLYGRPVKVLAVLDAKGNVVTDNAKIKRSKKLVVGAATLSQIAPFCLATHAFDSASALPVILGDLLW